MVTNSLWKSSIAKNISSSRGCGHLQCPTRSPPSIWALIYDHVIALLTGAKWYSINLASCPGTCGPEEVHCQHHESHSNWNLQLRQTLGNPVRAWVQQNESINVTVLLRKLKVYMLYVHTHTQTHTHTLNQMMNLSLSFLSGTWHSFSWLNIIDYMPSFELIKWLSHTLWQRKYEKAVQSAGIYKTCLVINPAGTWTFPSVWPWLMLFIQLIFLAQHLYCIANRTSWKILTTLNEYIPIKNWKLF